MELKLENINYNKNLCNLTIENGKITTIIGTDKNEIHNIFEIISLNKKSSNVTITIDKQIVNEKNINKLKQNISYCPEVYNFTKTTIKEQLEYVLKNYKNKDKENRIINTLKMVSLPDNYLEREINSLSSGEQRKLIIAIGLVTNPKILILNNPTKNLDTKNKEHITKLLKLMKLRYNKTIVITSKDSDFLLELSNNIYILDETIKNQNDKYKVFSNSALLKRCHLDLPKTIKFSKLVKNKTNINIGYRDNINDLIKDIYRFTETNK